MQLTAKLIQLFPIQKGTGKIGELIKQDIIVETEVQYPKKICISILGDKINEWQLHIGNLFDIESRKYNCKWFTDIKAWQIEVAGTSTQNNPDISNNTDEFSPMVSMLFFLFKKHLLCTFTAHINTTFV
jgi:hypothetical protein